MISPLPVHDLATFVTTRDALHTVAEHVLAKARFVVDGEIRLMASEGGFSTPQLDRGRRVRIEAGELVVDADDGSRRAPLTTVGDAGRFVGIEPGFPTELYTPATPYRPDEPLHVDQRAATELGAWYGFTAEVLDAFAAEVAEAKPSPLILWPEHFDQAFFTEDDEQARRANYGASPGDGGHPEPYLYVGPWGDVQPDPFWNATHFVGAVLPLSDLTGSRDPRDSAIEFLRRGRQLLVEM